MTLLRLIAICLGFLSATAASTADQPDLVIVVNDSIELTSITPEQLTEFFLKKKRQWPDGTPVRFVDRNSSAAERKYFLEKILKKTANELELYWVGQKLYTGDSAPLQVLSDSSVLQFVSSFKGAIGYVSPTAKIKAKQVKVLKIEFPEKE